VRTGKPSISRGHQLGEAMISTPRLIMVPREQLAVRPAPVRSTKRKAPPTPKSAAPVSKGLAPVPEAPATGPEPQGKAAEAPATVSEPPVPVPASPEYFFVHDRLTAIERLTRLRDQGALSQEEYAAEKAIVLALPADELVLHAPPPDEEGTALPWPRPDPGPPLVGRLFDWRIVPIALGAGLAFSYVTQPRETTRFLEAAFSLFGA
jgi:hypothetical protein